MCGVSSPLILLSDALIRSDEKLGQNSAPGACRSATTLLGASSQKNNNNNYLESLVYLDLDKPVRTCRFRSFSGFRPSAIGVALAELMKTRWGALVLRI